MIPFVPGIQGEEAPCILVFYIGVALAMRICGVYLAMCVMGLGRIICVTAIRDTGFSFKEKERKEQKAECTTAVKEKATEQTI